MTRDKEKKVGKEHLLLEAARLGQFEKLDSILSQLRQLKAKRRTNPLSSLRKTLGLNDIRDPVTGFTCLHHASLNGHSECVRLLLDYGAKPNALDYKGSSALHLASWAGNLDVVGILLGHERRQQHSSASSSTAAAAAAANNVELELQQISEDHTQRLVVDIDLCNNDNQTPISLAAQFGHHQVVAELLAHEANASIRNSQLESPLDLACLNGRLDTVDLLLKSSSADFPAQAELQRPQSSVFLQNPISPAHSFHSPSLAAEGRQLSLQTRRPSASSGSTWSSLLLRTKSFSKDLELDESQQQQGANCSSTGTARRRATLSKLDAIEKLLDHSPLHYAIRRGHLDIIRLLLYRYGANLLQTTARGSVLHEIATNCFGSCKHADVLALIFDYVRNSVPQENRSSYLDRLMNLKNAQMKNVFQVLNDINNRSANEIKLLIYQMSEGLAKENSSQWQPKEQVIQTISNNGKLTRQFSDSQQMNSFLTIRRGDSNRNHHPMRPAGPVINGTQTIDRSYQPKHRLEQSHHHQQDQQQRRALMMQQQQFQVANYQPTMTRSVSNLTHVPSGYNQSDLFLGDREAAQQQLQLANSHQDRRSKSRDFGSLLMEAKQSMGHQMDPYNNSNNSPTGPMKAHVWQPQHHQQQLVRSQTDCSHLMSSSGGAANQDHANDRKMINRHYHVYDFEFYPPRLQPAHQQQHPQQLQHQQQQQQQQQQRQQPPRIPNRPDPPDGLIGLNSALRSSTRSTMSTRVQQARAIFDNQPKSLENNNNHNSRLSLNVDPKQQQLRQQHQMDRFLGRHSKKIGVGGPNSDPNRGASIEQKQREDVRHRQQQLQPNICPTDPRLNLQQQLRQVQSSCSLESHLSEPQLFDTTRQAIMRDFDEMIGRELLNRDFSQIIGTSDLNRTSGSRSSILAGVMLEMDKYGERLTVSGTLKAPDPKRHSSSSSQAATPEPARQIAGNRQSVIYDLPSQAHMQITNSDSSTALERDIKRATTDRLAGGRTGQTVPTDQNMGTSPSAQVTINRPAFTEPPKVRPPPPPVIAPSSNASPLRVTAPLGGGPYDLRLGSPAGNSDQLGLLKMASITSNSSSSSGSSSSIMRLALNPRNVRGQAAKSATLHVDSDSGVCTSNSPASLSHDSSENANQSGGEAAAFSSLPIDPRPIPQTVPMPSLRHKIPAVRHRSRKSPSSNELPSPAQTNVQSFGPPSPTTAQMCIERALGTIEGNTHEMANQTSPNDKSSAVGGSTNRDIGYENCMALQEELRQVVDCGAICESLSGAIDEAAAVVTNGSIKKRPKPALPPKPAKFAINSRKF